MISHDKTLDDFEKGLPRITQMTLERILNEINTLEHE